ncbi:MAG: twin-arginine translocation signal domain-containing protein, partial [Verrucomicrobiota bacterium]|nr:twin-arginine translocation signal domain-containing protein [Verrucomicrobiota bacterium]
MKHDSIQRNRRDFLALSSLAALALPASAAPTPSTEDSHGYINFLKGKGEDVVPEGKWKAT